MESDIERRGARGRSFANAAPGASRSSTPTDRRRNTDGHHRAHPPREVLLEDFLTPLQVAQHRMAVSIGVPPRRINEIVHGKRRITADTTLRLARYFGTSDRLRLNPQTRCDLELDQGHLGAALEQIHPLQSA
ncbi:hypothetical protein GCM10023168_20840 [Fodinibacter luteus]|uniref:HTH cro/C1-type domain-containing protein n=1 Tax=Fodinibacter luteus TaxID=552064 RepID=A0ABP8KH52_9MICO